MPPETEDIYKLRLLCLLARYFYGGKNFLVQFCSCRKKSKDILKIVLKSSSSSCGSIIFFLLSFVSFWSSWLAFSNLFLWLGAQVEIELLSGRPNFVTKRFWKIGLNSMLFPWCLQAKVYASEPQVMEVCMLFLLDKAEISKICRIFRRNRVLPSHLCPRQKN